MGVLSAMDNPRIIALIPARGGSKRLPHKNTRDLNGVPLLAYAIATAREAGIFEEIVVSTDDYEVQVLAVTYGAAYVKRPSEYAQDDSPDIQWIKHALGFDREHRGVALPWTPAIDGSHRDAFCILRPTSPFRRGPWLRAAWEHFLAMQPVDSLRAMRPCSEHPGKMWRPIWDHGRLMTPLLPFRLAESPWHSSPTQELPPVYTQTAALEIAWTRTVEEQGLISGETVTAYLCAADAPEAIDVNTMDDWVRAQALATAHPEYLPPVGER